MDWQQYAQGASGSSGSGGKQMNPTVETNVDFSNRGGGGTIGLYVFGGILALGFVVIALIAGKD